MKKFIILSILGMVFNQANAERYEYLSRPTGKYSVAVAQYHLINPNICPDYYYESKDNWFYQNDSRHCHKLNLYIYYPTLDKSGKYLSYFSNDIQQIKLDIKLLKGEDYLLTIDRNLVKMKDAQHRIVPSIKKLEALVEPTRNTFETLDDNFYKNNEKRMEAANQVLVDIVETGYYIGKITLLVDTMQKALTKVKGELAELDKAINTVDEKVEDYILKNL